MKNKINKYKSHEGDLYLPPEERIKDLKVLWGMDIDLKTKRKLQRQGKKWIKYIKLHLEGINHYPNNFYHQGEMGFIEFFFFYKPKNKSK